MLYEDIIVKQGEIYEIMMNRPEKMNRLSNRCMDEIVNALKEATDDKKCYAIILGSSVENVFCYGGDLGDFRVLTPGEIKNYGDHFIKLHTSIRRTPKPVICAIEGEAMGGGFSLIDACDLAVCAEDALLSIPELISGLVPAMGIAGIFKEMTNKNLMSLGLLGRKLTASEAMQYGLVNKTTARKDVLKSAREMADSFAGKSPTAIAVFKEIYRQMDMYVYERRMETAQSLLISLFKSNDGQEVLNALEEERNPVWKGN